MARSTINLDDLFASMTPRRLTGTLDRGDTYAALLHLLDDARSGQDRTTAAELWTVLQTIPNSQVFGGRDRLHQLLRTAEDDGQIRRTAAGRILLRLDAPAGGGPEHVWVRLECRGGSEVEVTGADPWPDHQLHAPGPAWWRCTGCRAHSGTLAGDFGPVRAAATEHAATCRALPAPPAAD